MSYRDMNPYESDEPKCRHGNSGGLRGGCPDCRELELDAQELTLKEAARELVEAVDEFFHEAETDGAIHAQAEFPAGASLVFNLKEKSKAVRLLVDHPQPTHFPLQHPFLNSER